MGTWNFCPKFRIKSGVRGGTNPACAAFPSVRGGNLRMSRAGQYRRYAAECLRLATSSEDVREKAVLLQMAEQWRQLAERAETKDRES
jgi:hypothetical protein